MKPITLASLIVLLVSSSSLAGELSLDGPELFRRCTSSHARLNKDGRIVLERGVLIEDDGPAAGYSYQPNLESLESDVRIKKQLVVPRAGAFGAMLLVAPGGELAAEVNGRSASLESQGTVGKYWQAYSLDPTLLATGKNDIVLFGKGKIWVARAEDFAAGSTERPKHPNRSAKSGDGGETWYFDRLGTDDNLDGEYYVRLQLDQFHPAATITSSVLDAANLAAKHFAPPVADVGELQFVVAAATPARTQVRLEVRSGSTWVPSGESWSDWQQPKSAGEDCYALARPRGRFLQFRLHLQTDDPLVSPEVSSVRIQTDCKFADDWTRDVEVTEVLNGPLARSSIPFVYEPYDHRLLVELRENHKLDEVVSGAKGELELLERLAAWSATRWEGLGHLSEVYPAWNAHEILALHPDGKPVGGFCQQFNVVFLQACAAFGIPGRIVSIGPANDAGTIRSGHETVEVWSNEFGKWIYFDGNTAWYLIDAESRTPLSLLELRERQLDFFAGRPTPEVRAVTLAKTRYEWKGLKDWPAFAELRLVPRSNFLSERSPLPLNQGMRGWFWTGYHVWSDDRLPPTPIYSHFVTRREEWEPNIGGVELKLEPLVAVGHVRVHCDTQMPELAERVAAIDGGEPHTTPPVFEWKLRDGINRFEVQATNKAGRVGPASRIELRYHDLE